MRNGEAMSLYNLIHGVNPLASLLLGILRIDPIKDVARFRDCYLYRSEAGALEIHVFTRMGGGNRGHSGWNDDGRLGDPGCPCNGCLMEYRLTKHPDYLRDFDDSYDSTYATYAFRVVEPVRKLVDALASEPGAMQVPFEERSEVFLQKLREGKDDDPDVKRVIEALLPVFAQLNDQLKKTE